MSSTAPKSLDFLRETFSLAKIMLPKVWGVFIVYAAISLLTLFLYDPKAKLSDPSFWVHYASFALSYIIFGYYLETTALQQYKPTFIYPLSVRGLLAWLRAILMKFAIMFLPIFIVLPICIFILIGISGQATGTPSFIYFVAACMYLWIAITSTLLLLVSPMALVRNSPVLEKSWNLTRSHFWAIIGGELFLLFIYALFVIPLSAAYLAASSDAANIFSTQNIIVNLIGSFVGMGALFMGASFVCAVYRLLVQQTAGDSNSVAKTAS